MPRSTSTLPFTSSDCQSELPVRWYRLLPISIALLVLVGTSAVCAEELPTESAPSDTEIGEHREPETASSNGQRTDDAENDEHRESEDARPIFEDELDVMAERWSRRLREVPANIRLLDREQIELTSARTLAEAMEWTPGIRLESNCQSCNTTQARLLGLEGPYTQILVDGQPTVSSLALVYGLEQIPARMIDGLEIVKGGGSTLYGSGAVGGAIDLIPHQPASNRSAAEVRGSGMEGGGDGFSLSGLVDWVDRDGLNAISVLGQMDTMDPLDVDGDGFTEVAKRELTAAVARYERRAFEGAGRFNIELNITDAERRGGDLDRIDLPAHQSALAEEIFTDRAGASLGWMHMPNARFDYRLAFSYAESERESYYGAEFDPTAYGTTSNPLWSLDFQANHHHDRGLVTWGIQGNRDEITDRQPGFGRSIDATYEGLGFYIQDERRLGPAERSVQLLYGFRVDGHSELDDPAISPRLALLWKPREAFTVRASHARGFRPPMVFDEDLHIELLGGGEARVVRNAEDLREEQSAASLISAEWRPELGSRWASVLEVNLFHIELDDLFHVRDADDPLTPGFESLRENFATARVRGVELVAGLRRSNLWSAELAWTEQSSRFGEPDPDFGSRDFFRTPERYGLLSFDFDLPGQFEVFLGLRYTGPMKAPHYAGFIDQDRLETTPDFFTVDLNVSHALELRAGQQLTLSAGVRNIGNEFQQDLDQGVFRDSSYVYGPRFPRTVTFGLSWER